MPTALIGSTCILCFLWLTSVGKKLRCIVASVQNAQRLSPHSASATGTLTRTVSRIFSCSLHSQPPSIYTINQK